MCPPADEPINNGADQEMVAIETNTPHISSSSASQVNGAAGTAQAQPPAVKTHKGLYGRASDFLSNTSNWKVSSHFVQVIWSSDRLLSIVVYEWRLMVMMVLFNRSLSPHCEKESSSPMLSSLLRPRLRSPRCMLFFGLSLIGSCL